MASDLWTGEWTDHSRRQRRSRSSRWLKSSAVGISVTAPGCFKPVLADPVTPNGAPGAPTLSGATGGDGRVILRWAPSSDGGSPITGYNVYVGTSPGGEGSIPVNSSLITGTTYTVRGLTNWTTYYFVVEALNSRATSVASNQLSATPTLVFTVRPGSATDIAIGADGSVWVVGTNTVPGGHGIYHWNGHSWVAIPGGAVTIAVAPEGTPFIINSAHQTFEWTGTSWVRGPGTLTDIALGADGSLWSIGTNPVPGGFGIYRWPVAVGPGYREAASPSPWVPAATPG